MRSTLLTCKRLQCIVVTRRVVEKRSVVGASGATSMVLLCGSNP